MLKKINWNVVVTVAEVLTSVVLIACVIYTFISFILNFSYTPELGFYDVRSYRFDIGDYIKYGDAAKNYTYTNLGFREIMKLIW